MEKEASAINWEEIMTKFSSYDGVIAEFCRANNITPSQLFYRRKKLKEKSTINFHPIPLGENKSSEFSCDSTPHKIQEVRIEIGKATLFIPSNKIAILSEIVNELVKTC